MQIVEVKNANFNFISGIAQEDSSILKLRILANSTESTVLTLFVRVHEW